MIDDVVQYPNRYQLVPVAGTTDQFDLVRMPGAVTAVGTPINKATLLSDQTAALYGGATTPNEALLNAMHMAPWNKVFSRETAGAFSWTAPNVGGCNGALASSHEDPKYRTYQNIWHPILENLAVIFVVLGIGSLLLELFGYLSYFRTRLAEVFTEKELVDLLSDNYKKELKHSLFASIYKPDTVDAKEIVGLFDEKLSNLLNNYYYENLSIIVHCEMTDSDGKKYIKKEFTKKVKYREINSNTRNSIDSFLHMGCKEITGPNLVPFELMSVTVNKESVEYKILVEPSVSTPGHSEYKCDFLKPIEIAGALELVMKYKTIVPIEDKSYTFMVDKLCKNFEFKFFFNKEEMMACGYGFKFKTEPNDRFDIEYYNELLEMKSNGWLLPGEGMHCAILECSDECGG